MTRGKKLLLLLGALAVISLAAWGIVKLTDKEPELNLMTEGDVIFSLGDAQVISWVYDGQEFSFRITDDPWTFLPDESYRISQNAMANILDAITQIKSRKTVDLPEDLSIYGLAEPKCTITVGDTVMKIGNETQMTSQYYLYLGGDKVHLVNSVHVTPFLRTLADMTATEDIPNLSDMSQINITTTESLQLSYKEQVWYLGEEAADPEAVAQLTESLRNLRWQYCVDHKAQDLSAYGLDNPVATYVITYQENQTFTLLLGSTNTHGVYAMIEGSQMVYTLTSETGSALTQVSSDNLLPTQTE